ncbi:hypothetical protein ACJIZ3_002297 [Penstemon smallii]|uniref:Uncharacterized protein n=1 Tax=Penstemon smallii TaxID=265156 RepID=A0ABD3U620_9LAMI
METSTGRQALRNKRCRSVAESKRDPPPPLNSRLVGSIPSLTFSSNAGGEDSTNRSCSLFLTDNSLTISVELLSSLLLLRSGNHLPAPIPARPSSIRSVFLRRSWITGLVMGLLVGLAATAHWIARNLNFCRVAIRNLLLKRLRILIWPGPLESTVWD